MSKVARLMTVVLSVMTISSCSYFEPKIIDTSCSNFKKLTFSEEAKGSMTLEDKRMVDAHNRKYLCFCLDTTYCPD